MKYCVENDLSIFEFHDSVFSYVSFEGTDLIVSASMVNIHKDTPQNPSDYDMEIASARSWVTSNVLIPFSLMIEPISLETFSLVW